MKIFLTIHACSLVVWREWNRPKKSSEENCKNSAWTGAVPCVRSTHIQLNICFIQNWFLSNHSFFMWHWPLFGGFIHLRFGDYAKWSPKLDIFFWEERPFPRGPSISRDVCTRYLHLVARVARLRHLHSKEKRRKISCEKKEKTFTFPSCHSYCEWDKLRMLIVHSAASHCRWIHK